MQYAIYSGLPYLRTVHTAHIINASGTWGVPGDILAVESFNNCSSILQKPLNGTYIL